MNANIVVTVVCMKCDDVFVSLFQPISSTENSIELDPMIYVALDVCVVIWHLTLPFSVLRSLDDRFRFSGIIETDLPLHSILRRLWHRRQYSFFSIQ